jgi:hypothetical protein
MENELTLSLIKEDFEGTNYDMPCACAMSKAFKRQFDINAYEGIQELDFCIDGTTWVKYKHEKYTYYKFTEDQSKAKKAKDGEVIRIIHLTKENYGK